MTDIIADYGITLTLSILLDSGADVPQMFARSAFLNCSLKTFFGNPDEL